VNVLETANKPVCQLITVRVQGSQDPPSRPWQPHHQLCRLTITEKIATDRPFIPHPQPQGPGDLVAAKTLSQPIAIRVSESA